jgi:hypothetical protein
VRGGEKMIEKGRERKERKKREKREKEKRDRVSSHIYPPPSNVRPRTSGMTGWPFFKIRRMTL